MSMRRIYMQLGYDEYKQLEEAMRTASDRETTHTSMGNDEEHSRFYHRSLTLPIGDDLQIEFHGPNVAGTP